ncbi:MAG: hypothetical protein QXR45_08470 [Candidatus Bathyarchaeia archaeon]
MNNVVKSYIVITFLVIFLASMTFVNAQRIIVLENDKGVQKSSFLRGEGIVVSVTLPYDARVDVWLHTPPGTPGPSPIQLIQGALVRANIQEKLGPMWMDEKAPCGKYQFELRILDSQGRLTTEYRFFDYAMNEQPCATTATTITTTTITTTKDITVIIAGISGVAIAVVVALIVIYMLRAGARPPKERAPVAPPVAPPTPPPSPPPKTPYKRRPIVRGESREEEET